MLTACSLGANHHKQHTNRSRPFGFCHSLFDIRVSAHAGVCTREWEVAGVGPDRWGAKKRQEIGKKLLFYYLLQQFDLSMQQVPIG